MSASFEARSAPRSYPTHFVGAAAPDADQQSLLGTTRGQPVFDRRRCRGARQIDRNAHGSASRQVRESETAPNTPPCILIILIAAA
jgi:hypothetical protein